MNQVPAGHLNSYLSLSRMVGHELAYDHGIRWFQFAGPHEFQELKGAKQRDNFFFGGGTDIAGALIKTAEAVDPGSHIVVLTDGMTAITKEQRERLSVIEDKNISVTTILIGYDYDQVPMWLERPSGDLFCMGSHPSFTLIMERISTQLDAAHDSREFLMGDYEF